jgi:chromosome segregation ATPase
MKNPIETLLDYCSYTIDECRQIKAEILTLQSKCDEQAREIEHLRKTADVLNHERMKMQQEVVELRAKLKDMGSALQEAKSGLEWYQAMHPEDVDGSDDEAMERIDAALAPGAAPQWEDGTEPLVAGGLVKAGKVDTILRAYGAAPKENT